MDYEFDPNEHYRKPKTKLQETISSDIERYVAGGGEIVVIEYGGDIHRAPTQVVGRWRNNNKKRNGG